VESRLALEQAARDNPFLLLPHRPNYILPASWYSSPNDAAAGFANGELDSVEMKFQVSLKALLREGVFADRGNLYAAYTNTSWWQAYNREMSSPFRETNHEPELFLLFDTRYRWAGLTSSGFIVGLSHQSNGRYGAQSRSWNRFYASFLFERENLALSLTPWVRFPEEEKSSPDEVAGDDNPDIGRYMGHGQLGLLYKWRRHTMTLAVRNNLRSDNKGAVELGISYPFSSKLKGYFQLFDGYGESLIDYDHHTTRIGLGILMADWL
jgi:phospholipase A1